MLRELALRPSRGGVGAPSPSEEQARREAAVAVFRSEDFESATRAGEQLRLWRRNKREIWRLGTAVKRAPSLWRLWRACPTVEVVLTDSPEGRVIWSYYNVRWLRLVRTRLATQGALEIPESAADYFRGKRMQAARTNITSARKRGVTVEHTRLTTGLPPEKRHPEFPAIEWRVEHFVARSAAGEVIGVAYVTVDGRTAMLHTLDGRVDNARWVLHAAVVEALAGSVKLLLVNRGTVALLLPGVREFQRRLGFGIYNFKLRRVSA